MNRRSFLSLSAAATAAAALPVSSLFAGEEKKPQRLAQFDDACTARTFLNYYQDPDDYKWVEAGMRPPCEPRKHVGWYARAYSFLPAMPKKYPRLEECQPTILDYEYKIEGDIHNMPIMRCHVVVPWVEVWGNSAREVNLAKQKMLVDLLEHAATASFSRHGDGEPWWKTEVFRDHVHSADHRLKNMGFPNVRQILMPCRKLSPLGAISTSSRAVDMLVEALEVIHLDSNSPVGVMGCESCPENVMFLTAGSKHLGSFEQCSYVHGGHYISHVNMAVLNDYAVTKITF